MAYIRPDLYKAISENDIGDVVFQDPFSEEARKAKRNLVAASFAALLIAALGLQVNGFLGLQTLTGATLGGSITKGLACLITAYFLCGFLLSAYVDYAAWKFKRERVLVRPYLDLIEMLEAHVHVTGEQIDNATRRVQGIVIEGDMQSQVHFQEAIQNTSGQLTSIQESVRSLHDEFKPLLVHWSGLAAKLDRLSWRLRARFLSLWVLDLLIPFLLAITAIWRTYDGMPSVLWKIVA